MDEPTQDDPSDDPIVILDDEEEQAPPPRRRHWTWAVAAGLALVAVLGTLALRLGRRPEAPAAPLVFAAVTPELPPLEAAPEPLLDDPSEVQPPPPEPPPEPPPAPEPALVAKEEAPPPPPPPEEPEPSYECELAAAADAIRDAEPVFREAAEAIHRDDPRFVSARMDTAEGLLLKAREEYEGLRNRILDQETLETRLAILEELLGDLQEGRARIRVPLALKEAEALEREARSRGVPAEQATEKLRGARERLASVRGDVPDPKSLDRHLKRLDSQLAELERRHPSLGAR